ncbi:unnamed protein product [Jaminaea pallidilutea]
MAVHQPDDIHALLMQRRVELSATPGAQGLWHNPRSTAICFFASLGGLVYGYNQGMFGQVLSMTNTFGETSGIVGIQDATLSGFVTAILELGAWVGVLANGILADWLGRKRCVAVAVFFFTIGVIIQAVVNSGDPSYIYGGRFITGLGVGSLSMIVPLYNAELAPPETRGALVAVQQLAITFGIMISYWITYGTNYIGGTGPGQSDAAWLIPICIQLVPAFILGFGMYFMPQSPRWLIDVGKDDECLHVIARLRTKPVDHPLVQMEFLELKAQKTLETRMSQHDFPHLQDGSRKSNFLLNVEGYKSLFTNRANLKRTSVAVLTMLFQQWNGINFVLYFAPFIFASVGLDGNTTSLLASGVVGIVQFLATIPAVLFADKVGRKPLLISGAIVMGICHFIVAAIIAQFQGPLNDQGLPVVTNRSAGWAAVVFIWIFSIGFGFSWGPCAWVVVSEVFPLGLRAKGVSIGASSNWLNNFAVAMSTLEFLKAAPYGAYIFLGLMCFLGVAYIAIFVPETKNKTLDEIAVCFGDKSGRSVRETQMLEQAYADVGLFDAAGITLPKSYSHDSGEGEKPQAFKE